MKKLAALLAVIAMCGAAWAGYFYRTNGRLPRVSDLTVLLSAKQPPTDTSKPRSSGMDRADPVVTEVIQLEDFPIRRRTIGLLESPAIVVIRSRFDSLVLEQHVVDGQIVHKGDLLFTLDDRELRAVIARDQATLVKDQAALTQTTSALERTQELADKKIASQQTLEQAIAAQKAAQQTVEASQAVLQADELRLGYAKLAAPISGRIGAVRVAPGNLVSVNDATGLVTLTQMQPLRVNFTLPERDLAALRAAEKRTPQASVRIYAPNESEPLAAGNLIFVDTSVDSTSGTIAAKASFANENYKLRPGQYVDVEIDLAERPGTTMVPSVAIQNGQKGPYVFIAKADQTVEIRPVTLAGVEGNRTAIEKGLSAGERIVVQGQLRLTEGKKWQEAEPAPPEKNGSSPSEAGVAVPSVARQ